MSNNLFVSFKKVYLEICLFLSKEKADFPWFYQENRPYERAGIRTWDNLIKSRINLLYLLKNQIFYRKEIYKWIKRKWLN